MTTETTAPDALLPCAHCAGAAGRMKYLEPDEPHWYICCHGCGMETDVFPSIEQADAAWNRRIMGQEQQP
jgi:hypothetical protein